MNRLMLTLMVVGSLLLVTGCVTERVYYTPSYYTPKYIYSTSYYNTNPYWEIDYYNDADGYYYGYNDLGNVGYWGMYNSYQVY
ncbi:hypothetical protein Lgra_0888 [Legionella gratiana]|uniref:Lipoprotein n=1 Tax=Legionella gratiana TaxID=45066 RepID=A0A378JEC5_9GAMM|nr:hypothetical protein [Legionella gratiana]KTD13596.1 hypothetical protein Lgra_0888 [Legionella gratiana]STX46193.1 Uncharacterised protein [Legionella gratiana]